VCGHEMSDIRKSGVFERQNIRVCRNPVWWTLKRYHNIAVSRSANPKNRYFKVRNFFPRCVDVCKSIFLLHGGPQIHFGCYMKVRKSKTIAALTTADPVCADVNTSAEIWCGVRTLNR